MNIIGKKNIFFIISLLVIIPGLISLVLWGLKPSIDFTGGSRMEIQSSQFKEPNSKSQIEELIKKQGVEVNSVQKSGDNNYIIRTKTLSQNQYQRIKTEIGKEFKDPKELSFATIGPTISQEITLNAIKSVIFASILIVLYIAWAFRKVSKPLSSWRFGICAVTALIHDVLVVIGIFSILGHFFNVEIDSLFVTALLTVIGFSVHDTIVVFDRIRENLRKMGGSEFPVVVNDSILQTLGRSLNTSITVLLVLFTLLIFGGESVKWFIVALLVGVISGTYSSIFNAAPLLVVWEQWKKRKS